MQIIMYSRHEWPRRHTASENYRYNFYLSHVPVHCLDLSWCAGRQPMISSHTKTPPLSIYSYWNILGWFYATCRLFLFKHILAYGASKTYPVVPVPFSALSFPGARVVAEYGAAACRAPRARAPTTHRYRRRLRPRRATSSALESTQQYLFICIFIVLSVKLLRPKKVTLILYSVLRRLRLLAEHKAC